MSNFLSNDNTNLNIGTALCNLGGFSMALGGRTTKLTVAFGIALAAAGTVIKCAAPSHDNSYYHEQKKLFSMTPAARNDRILTSIWDVFNGFAILGARGNNNAGYFMILGAISLFGKMFLTKSSMCFGKEQDYGPYKLIAKPDDEKSKLFPL